MYVELRPHISDIGDNSLKYLFLVSTNDINFLSFWPERQEEAHLITLGLDRFLSTKIDVYHSVTNFWFSSSNITHLI